MREEKDRPRNTIGQYCRAGEEDGPYDRPAGEPSEAAKGWTKAREAAFFRNLGILGDLGQALEAAGLPADGSEVQTRLESDPRFRARWNAALAAGYALLELEMQGRARFGAKRRVAKTAVEKKLREVPSSVALQLLKLHHARTRGQPGSAGQPQDRPLPNTRELRKRLLAKLSDFNRRMGGDG